MYYMDMYDYEWFLQHRRCFYHTYWAHDRVGKDVTSEETATMGFRTNDPQTSDSRYVNLVTVH